MKTYIGLVLVLMTFADAQTASACLFGRCRPRLFGRGGFISGPVGQPAPCTLGRCGVVDEPSDDDEDDLLGFSGGFNSRFGDSDGFGFGLSACGLTGGGNCGFFNSGFGGNSLGGGSFFPGSFAGGFGGFGGFGGGLQSGFGPGFGLGSPFGLGTGFGTGLQSSFGSTGFSPGFGGAAGSFNGASDTAPANAIPLALESPVRRLALEGSTPGAEPLPVPSQAASASSGVTTGTGTPDQNQSGSPIGYNPTASPGFGYGGNGGAQQQALVFASNLVRLSERLGAFFGRNSRGQLRQLFFDSRGDLNIVGQGRNVLPEVQASLALAYCANIPRTFSTFNRIGFLLTRLDFLTFLGGPQLRQTCLNQARLGFQLLGPRAFNVLQQLVLRRGVSPFLFQAAPSYVGGQPPYGEYPGYATPSPPAVKPVVNPAPPKVPTEAPEKLRVEHVGEHLLLMGTELHGVGVGTGNILDALKLNDNNLDLKVGSNMQPTPQTLSSVLKFLCARPDWTVVRNNWLAYLLKHFDQLDSTIKGPSCKQGLAEKINAWDDASKQSMRIYLAKKDVATGLIDSVMSVALTLPLPLVKATGAVHSSDTNL